MGHLFYRNDPFLGLGVHAMRKTKAFSFEARDDRWFRMLSREAKKNRRPESQEMISILKQHFERQKMVAELNGVSEQ